MISLASMQEELAKLELIRRVDLPADLLDHALPRELERCRLLLPHAVVPEDQPQIPPLHGLGHGLDDNAVKAAEQIHFKPAVKDGQPTDSTVVVHIIFQIA